MSEERTFDVLGVQLPVTDGMVTIDSANLKKLKDRMGLNKALKMVACVAPPIGCGREIPLEEIQGWDELSVKEYAMSGLCKSPCQDKVFSDPDEKIGSINPECTCSSPCCEVDVGIGIIDCDSQHCAIHGLNEMPIPGEPDDNLIPEDQVL